MTTTVTCASPSLHLETDREPFSVARTGGRKGRRKERVATRCLRGLPSTRTDITRPE